MIIFSPINLNMCFIALKNRLDEMVLLSTHIICFGREIKKIVFQYALLSGGLMIIIIIIMIIIIIIKKCDSEN